MDKNCYYQVDEIKLQALLLDEDSISYLMEARVLQMKDKIQRLVCLEFESHLDGTIKKMRLEVDRIIMIH